MNTPNKKYISVSKLTQERKQIKVTLDAIRINNNKIGGELAGIIRIVGDLRASQLGIDLMIEQLLETLG